MRRLIACCWISLAGACASSGQRARAPRPASTASAAPDLAILAASVRAVSLETHRANHGRLAKALHGIADHVRVLQRGPESARIATAADRLAASPDDANAHVEIVVRALRQSQRALEKRAPDASARAVSSLAALDDALDALDSARPLAEQHDTVLAALEAATNAIALLQSKPPPFPEANPRWVPRPPDVALASARALTLAIARAEIGEAAPAIGRLLDDLASLVHAFGPAASEHVTRLRFHARRLAGDRPGLQQEARWIREALAAALDGLEAGRDERFADARAAVNNISLARSLVFQRARVQDAVRATLAAFVRSQERGEATTTATR